MKNLILPLISLFLLFSACKKEGCADQDAVNYEEKSKDDDGSCEYVSDLYVGIYILKEEKSYTDPQTQTEVKESSEYTTSISKIDNSTVQISRFNFENCEFLKAKVTLTSLSFEQIDCSQPVNNVIVSRDTGTGVLNFSYKVNEGIEKEVSGIASKQN